MLIVTNFAGFPRQWMSSSGQAGQTRIARDWREFVQQATEADSILLVNCEPRLVMELAAYFLAFPFRRRPLVSADLVLRRPATRVALCTLPLKRFLLSRVDHHIHYFKDLSGYQELFGIQLARSSFVPFKANLHRCCANEAEADGEYVLCFGRSLRDYDTFFRAMEQLPYPAAISRPDFAQLRAHDARFTRNLNELPNNLRLLEDDGTDQAQIRILSRARMVVLPILKSSIAASGISTCLNAMLLGRCVIGTAGPGMSDIFSEEALIVPPEDPDRLAEQIRLAWKDDELRRRTAQFGHRYVLGLGGEPEFHQRIIDCVAGWHATACRAGG